MDTGLWKDLQQNRFADEMPLTPPRALNAYRLQGRQRQEQDLQDLALGKQELDHENAILKAQVYSTWKMRSQFARDR